MQKFPVQRTHSRYESEETLQSELTSEGSSFLHIQQRKWKQEEVEQKIIGEEIRDIRQKKREIALNDTAACASDTDSISDGASSNTVERILAGNLQGVAILSHFIMLALHVGLFIIYWVGVPIGPPFNSNNQVFADTWLTVALQCFGVIQTTLMLFSAQQLAMRGILMRKTTVTGLHDVSQSWSGLGSAMSNLYNQTKVRATLSAPFLAFLYLICTAGLHITTPALLGVEIFSSNESVPINTHGWLDWTKTREDKTKFLFLEPIGQTMLPYVRELYDGSLNNSHSSSSAIGLHGGSVYAIPDDNTGVGAILVNASYFGVQCGEAGDAFHIDYDDERNVYIFNVTDGQRGWNNEFAWKFETKETMYFTNSSIQIFPIEADISMHAGVRIDERKSDVIYIMSTVDILDDSLQKGNTMVSIEPPMKYNLRAIQDDHLSTGRAGLEVESIQILQCIFKPQQWSLYVDAQTKLVLPGTALTPGNHDTPARYFEPMNRDKTYPYRPNQGSEYEYDIFTLITMFNKAVQVPLPRYGNFTETFDKPHPSLEEMAAFSSFRIVDEHLMRSLDLVPDVIYGHFKTGSIPTEISLRKLEEALANMSAAMYWAELHVSANRYPYPMELFPEFLQDGGVRSFQTYMSEVMVSKQQARVNLNIIPLAAGLGLTIGLVILLFLLLRHGVVSSDSIHGLGVLDIIWMSRRHTEVDWEIISDARGPSVDDLRRRGRGVEIDLSRLLQGEALQGSPQGTECL